jgi:hypothetical protein
MATSYTDNDMVTWWNGLAKCAQAEIIEAIRDRARMQFMRDLAWKAEDTPEALTPDDLRQLRKWER